MFFWIISSIFHLIMVPLSIINYRKHPETQDSRVYYQNFKQTILRKTDETQIKKKESVPKSLSRNLNLIFLIILIVFSLIMLWDPNFMTGAMEVNYDLIIGLFLSPLFYLGIGIALLNSKLKFLIIGDGIVLPFIVLTIMGISLFPPLILGYAIMRLFLHESNQTSTSHASTIVYVTLAWTIGLLLLTWYGILDLGASLGSGSIWSAEFTKIFIFLILIFIFCISLGFFSIEKYLSKRKKKKKSMSDKGSGKAVEGFKQLMGFFDLLNNHVMDSYKENKKVMELEKFFELLDKSGLDAKKIKTLEEEVK